MKTFNRRAFLQASSVLGGGLLIGLAMPVSYAQSGNERKEQTLLPLIKITPQGEVVVPLIMSEMGQGVYTSLPQIIAEELDASWQSIKVVDAEADEEKYGYQGTLASLSILLAWRSHRDAGAKARHMLIAAAADIWQVEKSACETSQGVVYLQGSDKKLTYGQLASLAAKMPVPEKVSYKSPEQYNIIGKSVQPLDISDKVTGKTQFGIDVNFPGLLTSVILKKPVFGAKIKSYDRSAALAVRGVSAVLEISSGLAVVASNYWSATKALRLLEAKWDLGKYKSFSSQDLVKQLKNKLSSPDILLKTIGHADKQLANNQGLSAIFEFPLLAHAPMEPVNFTAHVQSGKCELWGPTQDRGRVKETVAKLLAISADHVKVNTTFIGGGFGRKVQQDFVIDAVEVSKQLKLPVKVVWSRENDIQHGIFRPMSIHKLTAKLGKDKQVSAWQHTVSAHGSKEQAWLTTAGADHLPYNIEHFQANAHIIETPIPVGTLRGIAHSSTNFANEVFLTQLAMKAEIDPLALRLSMLRDKPRAIHVLKRVAAIAQWGVSKNNTYQGIALFDKTKEGSTFYIAQVVELVKRGDGKLKITKVYTAADFGQPINPNGIKAQVEGGTAFALSMALYGQIDIENGQVKQSNFHDYQVLRIPFMPQIITEVIENNESPIGCGENINPATLPALANAVAKATGQVINKLPLGANIFVS
ncbi:MAG: xanthine dehydrogenase family protein molybdopterin-binding subunit [Colwellia sp.]|nr:xanthine dehydrogenase family protein molybdopterin-binding subunit [Colwellia sp.]